MSTTTHTGQAAVVREPWFRGHRTGTVVVIGVLFAAILLVRLLMRPVADASSMLYVLPVALAALAFGWRAGVLAGVTGIALIGVWAVVTSASLSPVGWISRAAPLLLLGYLLGDASDRLRRAEDDRLRAEAAALLYRQAIEINDSIVQGMAAARWALESGRAEAGMKILDTTMGQAQELVSELIRQAGLGVPAPTPVE
ncbi:hypothetical protein ABZS29_21020 [Kribbella sp. NPDC005582]|uniref:hypothetical protein n=1 Tax=Kribbella sp. NPDC005582 TaxID=3156893 RepID=UPI00339FC818